jgi:hypothetical protein
MALLVKKNTTDDLIIDNGSNKNSLDKIVSKDKKTKKVNKSWVFIKSVFVDIVWPKGGQVVGWFFTTIFVCTALAFLMHYTDNVYKAGFYFVECSSPAGKDQLIVDKKVTDTCFKDLPKNIINGR